MAYYDKETSDELKDKFKDLAKPTGADFSGLVGYFDKGLQGMDVVASTDFKGDKGDKGDDGLSAYQVAVINGYKGSQTEWLASLVGAKGDKGDKGDTGKDFQIVKTFPSIAEMKGDGFSDGDFTMIASDVNDPDDGKLYVWNGTGFTYIADLSGSQGIKGDTGNTGDKGDKGDTGDQGLSAYQVAVNAGFSGSVNQWLASLVGPKGDTGEKGDPGPTGTVDNAGLTTAPAFQSLQTQVDNSAVGANLLTNTGDLSANWSLNGNVDTSQKPVILHYPTTTLTNNVNLIAQQQLNDGLLQPSTTYTTSFYAKGTGTMTFYCFPGVSIGEGGGSDTRTAIALTSDYKLYTITFTTFPNISGNKTFLIRQDYSPTETDENTVEAYVYGFKLEKGSVATDWCPALEDLVNKADYTNDLNKVNSSIGQAKNDAINSSEQFVKDNYLDKSQTLNTNAGVINADDDLNSYTNEGIYTILNASNLKNLPIEVSDSSCKDTLVIIRYLDDLKQVYISNHTSNIIGYGGIFIRDYTNSIWSSWKDCLGNVLGEPKIFLRDPINTTGEKYSPVQSTGWLSGGVTFGPQVIKTEDFKYRITTIDGNKTLDYTFKGDVNADKMFQYSNPQDTLLFKFNDLENYTFIYTTNFGALSGYSFQDLAFSTNNANIPEPNVSFSGFSSITITTSEITNKYTGEITIVVTGKLDLFRNK